MNILNSVFLFSEVLQENTQAPPNKINELAQPKKKIFNNLNNNIIGINSGGGYRTETPDSEENSGEDQTDNVGSNSSFESITKLPSAITTPAYESDAATDSEYFGMTGEDSETERFEVDNEEVTTTDEPTTTIKSSTETTSESIIDLTTLVSKPYARQRTTFSYTTRSPLPSSTTESIKETTISNRRFRTTTNPPEELTTITTTTTTTTDPSYRLSSDWGVANRNQVVSTTTESMDATTVSRNKGTNEDDLEEFTFGTTTMNPVTETTTQTVRNPSQDIEAASTTYYSSSSSLTTTHLSISTTPPFVHTEAPTTVAEDHEESSEVNSEDNDDDEEKHQNEVPTGKNDGGDIIDLITKTVNKDDVDATTSSAFTSPSNIEVIKPYQPESKLKPHERNSNESFVDDMNKFEEMISGSGAIAAIAISAVGFVALILLIGLLVSFFYFLLLHLQKYVAEIVNMYVIYPIWVHNYIS